MDSHSCGERHQVNIAVVTGSRADYGLLEWPLKCLREDPFFDVAEVRLWGNTAAQALENMTQWLKANDETHCVLLLGDRFEVLSAAFAAHLHRVPIAHIAGGDVSLGSYDDAMRDCISRLATIHFVTSFQAQERLRSLGYTHLHLVGNPGVDYIRHADWKKERTINEPYVVVAYYPETIDGTVDLPAVYEAIGERKAVWITPNPDAGIEQIPAGVSLEHADFLNLLVHCEEFIGNSSAMFYEAPELGVRCRLIGKRQQGRVRAWGDGRASERIRDALKGWHGQAKD